MKPEIMLANGRYFNFREPDPAVVTIDIIAASLSKQCRFSGHVSRFYSVAEHCVRASWIEPTLEMLMHDAAEAFVVDLPTPLKRMLPDYQEVDRRTEALVAEVFGLTHPWPARVKEVDLIMLATEKRDLMPAGRDDWWSILADVTPDSQKISRANHAGEPWCWEIQFLKRFDELSKERAA